jgi:hypothetical protein
VLRIAGEHGYLFLCASVDDVVISDCVTSSSEMTVNTECLRNVLKGIGRLINHTNLRNNLSVFVELMRKRTINFSEISDRYSNLQF